MKLCVDAWRTAFFAMLGFSQAAACGGQVETGEADPSGGAEGDLGSDAGGDLGSDAGGDAVAGRIDAVSQTELPPQPVEPTPGGPSVAPASGRASCAEPQPVLDLLGEPTGLEECAAGHAHRYAARRCPSRLPRAEPARESDTDVMFAECRYDRDCSDKAHGYCRAVYMQPGGLWRVTCHEGCVEDSDCDPGELCLCDDPVGTCRPAGCRTNADCEEGALCASYSSFGCSWNHRSGFECQHADDECEGPNDCTQACSVFDGIRRCDESVITCGRPFLVGGEPRLAESVRRSDWCGAGAATGGEVLEPALRAALCDTWTELGRMEHASVAAFARFTLQLLAMGAPAELVQAAVDAAADEVEHARLCFGLARRYGGKAVGPGPLRVDDSLAEASPEQVLRMVVREGCIGETVAAVEAAEAFERATDPRTRSVLARIAKDETRHAALAWRYVQWALAQGQPEVSEIVGRECWAALEREVEGERVPMSETLSAYGVLGAEERQEIRRRVLSEIVGPTLREVARAALGVRGESASSTSSSGAAESGSRSRVERLPIPLASPQPTAPNSARAID